MKRRFLEEKNVTKKNKQTKQLSLNQSNRKRKNTDTGINKDKKIKPSTVFLEIKPENLTENIKTDKTWQEKFNELFSKQNPKIRQFKNKNFVITSSNDTPELIVGRWKNLEIEFQCLPSLRAQNTDDHTSREELHSTEIIINDTINLFSLSHPSVIKFYGVYYPNGTDTTSQNASEQDGSSLTDITLQEDTSSTDESFYGAFQANAAYLVMEHCAHGTLKDYASKLIEEHKVTAIRQSSLEFSKDSSNKKSLIISCWQWALEIVSAVEYIHSQKTYCRNLSQDTILIDSKGRAKISMLKKYGNKNRSVNSEAKFQESINNSQLAKLQAKDFCQLSDIFQFLEKSIQNVNPNAKGLFDDIIERCQQTYEKMNNNNEINNAQDATLFFILQKLKNMPKQIVRICDQPSWLVTSNLIMMLEQLELDLDAKQAEMPNYLQNYVAQNPVSSMDGFWQTFENTDPNLWYQMENRPFLFDECFNEFLVNSKQNNLLFSGDSGLGKTFSIFHRTRAFVDEWWDYINQTLPFDITNMKIMLYKNSITPKSRIPSHEEFFIKNTLYINIINDEILALYWKNEGGLQSIHRRISSTEAKVIGSQLEMDYVQTESTPSVFSAQSLRKSNSNSINWFLLSQETQKKNLNPEISYTSINNAGGHTQNDSNIARNFEETLRIWIDKIVKRMPISIPSLVRSRMKKASYQNMEETCYIILKEYTKFIKTIKVTNQRQNEADADMVFPQILMLLDGYDEIKFNQETNIQSELKPKQQLYKILQKYLNNKLKLVDSHMNFASQNVNGLVKIITTSRPEATEISDTYHLLFNAAKGQDTMHCHFLPFNIHQVTEFLGSDIKKCPKKIQNPIEDIKHNPETRIIWRNPFVLSLFKASLETIANSFKQYNYRNITRWEIYQCFIVAKINQINSLLTPHVINQLTGDHTGSLLNNFKEFATDIACLAYINNSSRISIALLPNKLGNSIWINFREKLHQLAFTNSSITPTTILLCMQLLEGLPLKQHNGYLEFVHQTFLEFCFIDWIFLSTIPKNSIINEEEKSLLKILSQRKMHPLYDKFILELWSEAWLSMENLETLTQKFYDLMNVGEYFNSNYTQTVQNTLKFNVMLMIHLANLPFKQTLSGNYTHLYLDGPILQKVTFTLNTAFSHSSVSRAMWCGSTIPRALCNEVRLGQEPDRRMEQSLSKLYCPPSPIYTHSSDVPTITMLGVGKSCSIHVFSDKVEYSTQPYSNSTSIPIESSSQKKKIKDERKIKEKQNKGSLKSPLDLRENHGSSLFISTSSTFNNIDPFSLTNKPIITTPTSSCLNDGPFPYIHNINSNIIDILILDPKSWIILDASGIVHVISFRILDSSIYLNAAGTQSVELRKYSSYSAPHNNLSLPITSSALAASAENWLPKVKEQVQPIKKMDNNDYFKTLGEKVKKISNDLMILKLGSSDIPEDLADECDTYLKEITKLLKKQLSFIISEHEQLIMLQKVLNSFIKHLDTNIRMPGNETHVTGMIEICKEMLTLIDKKVEISVDNNMLGREPFSQGIGQPIPNSCPITDSMLHSSQRKLSGTNNNKKIPVNVIVTAREIRPSASILDIQLLQITSNTELSSLGSQYNRSINCWSPARVFHDKEQVFDEITPPHTAKITSIVFSRPDSPFQGYMASASLDGSLRIWKTRSLHSIACLRPEPNINAGGICCAIFLSEQPKKEKNIIEIAKIACGYEDGSIRIWSIFTPFSTQNQPRPKAAIPPKCVTIEKSHVGAVAITCLAICKIKNDTCLVAGDDDGILRILSLEQQRVVKSFRGNLYPIKSLLWVPLSFNKVVAGIIYTLSSNDNGTVISGFHLPAEKAELSYGCSKVTAHLDQVVQLRFRKNGDIISASYDGTVKIFASSTGRCFESWQYPSSIHSMDIHYNGEKKEECIITGHRDGSIYLARFDKEPKQILKGNDRSAIKQIICCQDYILSMNTANEVYTHTIREERITNPCLVPMNNKQMVVLSYFSNYNKNYFLSAYKDTIQLWKLSSKKPIGRPRSSISISSLAKGTSITTVKTDCNPSSLSCCFPEYLIIGYNNGMVSVHLLSINTLKKKKRLKIHKGKFLHPHNQQVNCVVLIHTTNGMLLGASGSEDETICLWSIEKKRTSFNLVLKHTLVEHTRGVLSLLLAPEGNSLISSDKNYAIFLWEYQTSSNEWHIKRMLALWSTFNAKELIIEAIPGSTCTAITRNEQLYIQYGAKLVPKSIKDISQKTQKNHLLFFSRNTFIFTENNSSSLEIYTINDNNNPPDYRCLILEETKQKNNIIQLIAQSQGFYFITAQSIKMVQIPQNRDVLEDGMQYAIQEIPHGLELTNQQQLKSVCYHPPHLFMTTDDGVVFYKNNSTQKNLYSSPIKLYEQEKTTTQNNLSQDILLAFSSYWGGFCLVPATKIPYITFGFLSKDRDNCVKSELDVTKMLNRIVVLERWVWSPLLPLINKDLCYQFTLKIPAKVDRVHMSKSGKWLVFTMGTQIQVYLIETSNNWEELYQNIQRLSTPNDTSAMITCLDSCEDYNGQLTVAYLSSNKVHVLYYSTTNVCSNSSYALIDYNIVQIAFNPDQTMLAVILHNDLYQFMRFKHIGSTLDVMINRATAIASDNIYTTRMTISSQLPENMSNAVTSNRLIPLNSISYKNIISRFLVSENISLSYKWRKLCFYIKGETFVFMALHDWEHLIYKLQNNHYEFSLSEDTPRCYFEEAIPKAAGYSPSNLFIRNEFSPNTVVALTSNTLEITPTSLQLEGVTSPITTINLTKLTKHVIFTDLDGQVKENIIPVSSLDTLTSKMSSLVHTKDRIIIGNNVGNIAIIPINPRSENNANNIVSSRDTQIISQIVAYPDRVVLAVHCKTKCLAVIRNNDHNNKSRLDIYSMEDYLYETALNNTQMKKIATANIDDTTIQALIFSEQGTEVICVGGGTLYKFSNFLYMCEAQVCCLKLMKMPGDKINCLVRGKDLHGDNFIAVACNKDVQILSSDNTIIQTLAVKSDILDLVSFHFKSKLTGTKRALLGAVQSDGNIILWVSQMSKFSKLVWQEIYNSDNSVSKPLPNQNAVVRAIYQPNQGEPVKVSPLSLVNKHMMGSATSIDSSRQQVPFSTSLIPDLIRRDDDDQKQNVLQDHQPTNVALYQPPHTVQSFSQYPHQYVNDREGKFPMSSLPTETIYSTHGAFVGRGAFYRPSINNNVQQPNLLSALSATLSPTALLLGADLGIGQSNLLNSANLPQGIKTQNFSSSPFCLHSKQVEERSPPPYYVKNEVVSNSSSSSRTYYNPRLFSNNAVPPSINNSQNSTMLNNNNNLK